MGCAPSAAAARAAPSTTQASPHPLQHASMQGPGFLAPVAAGGQSRLVRSGTAASMGAGTSGASRSVAHESSAELDVTTPVVTSDTSGTPVATSTTSSIAQQAVGGVLKKRTSSLWRQSAAAGGGAGAAARPTVDTASPASKFSAPPTLERSSISRLTSFMRRKSGQVGASAAARTAAERLAAAQAALPPAVLDSEAGPVATLTALQSAGVGAQDLVKYYATVPIASRSPKFFTLLGEMLIAKHEPLLADDVLYTGSKQFPSELPLKLMHCKTLAQGGSTERAIQLLEGVRSDNGGRLDDDSSGLLARCYKDLAQRQKISTLRTELLTKAYTIYYEAFVRSNRTSYYTGINAATMSVLLGHLGSARDLAAEVVTICEANRAASSNQPASSQYWILATLGEASLIAGQFIQAVTYYTMAVATAPNNHVMLASTKKQLHLLLDHLSLDERAVLAEDDELHKLTPGCRYWLEQLHRWHKTHLHITPTLYIDPNATEGNTKTMQVAARSPTEVSKHTGRDASKVSAPVAAASAAACGCKSFRQHLFDDVFRMPRVTVFISAEMHDAVVPAVGSQVVMATQFARVLDKIDAKFGYASPNTLADIVFLETVKRRGGQIYIVLPVPLDVHLRACAVRFAEMERLGVEPCGPFCAQHADFQKDPVIKDLCHTLNQSPDVVAMMAAQAGASSGSTVNASRASGLSFSDMQSHMFDQEGVLRAPGAASAAAGTVVGTSRVAPAAAASPAGSNSTQSSAGALSALVPNTPTPAVQFSGYEDVCADLPYSIMLRRLCALLAHAEKVDISNDMSPESSVTNRHYCSLVLNGLAVMRARTLGATIERIYLAPNVMRVGMQVGQRPGDVLQSLADVESMEDNQSMDWNEVQRRRRRLSQQHRRNYSHSDDSTDEECEEVHAFSDGHYLNISQGNACASSSDAFVSSAGGGGGGGSSAGGGGGGGSSAGGGGGVMGGPSDTFRSTSAGLRVLSSGSHAPGLHTSILSQYGRAGESALLFGDDALPVGDGSLLSANGNGSAALPGGANASFRFTRQRSMARKPSNMSFGKGAPLSRVCSFRAGPGGVVAANGNAGMVLASSFTSQTIHELSRSKSRLHMTMVDDASAHSSGSSHRSASPPPGGMMAAAPAGGASRKLESMPSFRVSRMSETIVRPLDLRPAPMVALMASESSSHVEGVNALESPLGADIAAAAAPSPTSFHSGSSNSVVAKAAAQATALSPPLPVSKHLLSNTELGAIDVTATSKALTPPATARGSGGVLSARRRTSPPPPPPPSARQPAPPATDKASFLSRSQGAVANPGGKAAAMSLSISKSESPHEDEGSAAATRSGVVLPSTQLNGHAASSAPAAASQPLYPPGGMLPPLLRPSPLHVGVTRSTSANGSLPSPALLRPPSRGDSPAHTALLPPPGSSNGGLRQLAVLSSGGGSPIVASTTAQCSSVHSNSSPGGRASYSRGSEDRSVATSTVPALNLTSAGGGSGVAAAMQYDTPLLSWTNSARAGGGSQSDRSAGNPWHALRAQSSTAPMSARAPSSMSDPRGEEGYTDLFALGSGATGVTTGVHPSGGARRSRTGSGGVGANKLQSSPPASHIQNSPIASKLLGAVNATPPLQASGGAQAISLDALPRLGMLQSGDAEAAVTVRRDISTRSLGRVQSEQLVDGTLAGFASQTTIVASPPSSASDAGAFAAGGSSAADGAGLPVPPTAHWAKPTSRATSLVSSMWTAAAEVEALDTSVAGVDMQSFRSSDGGTTAGRSQATLMSTPPAVPVSTTSSHKRDSYASLPMSGSRKRLSALDMQLSPGATGQAAPAQATVAGQEASGTHVSPNRRGRRTSSMPSPRVQNYSDTGSPIAARRSFDAGAFSSPEAGPINTPAEAEAALAVALAQNALQQRRSISASVGTDGALLSSSGENLTRRARAASKSQSDMLTAGSPPVHPTKATLSPQVAAVSAPMDMSAPAHAHASGRGAGGNTPTSSVTSRSLTSASPAATGGGAGGGSFLPSISGLPGCAARLSAAAAAPGKAGGASPPFSAAASPPVAVGSPSRSSNGSAGLSTAASPLPPPTTVAAVAAVTTRPSAGAPATWAGAVAQSLSMEDGSSAADMSGSDSRAASPEIMESPNAAAVFAGIPSAVEQWVQQEFSFRVLFMDSMLFADAATDFEDMHSFQLVYRHSTLPPSSDRQPDCTELTQHEAGAGALVANTSSPTSAHSADSGLLTMRDDATGMPVSTGSGGGGGGGGGSSTGAPIVLETLYESTSSMHTSSKDQGVEATSSHASIAHSTGSRNSQRIVSTASVPQLSLNLLPVRETSAPSAEGGMPTSTSGDTDTPSRILVSNRGATARAPSMDAILRDVVAETTKPTTKFGITSMMKSMRTLGKSHARVHDISTLSGGEAAAAAGGGGVGADVTAAAAAPSPTEASAATSAAAAVAGAGAIAMVNASVPPPPSDADGGELAHGSDESSADDGKAHPSEVMDLPVDMKRETERLESMANKQVIMAILFADIVGYSKLGEMQVLTFVERFLRAVALLIDALPPRSQPKVRNTWGDAVYFVFARVPDAGVFGLLLSDLVTRIAWWKLGLPKSLSIRISLHAAPVHPVVDPITRTKNYTGVHTSRAARIEPITPPGCVYCSQAFAAMSETLCVTQYECSYVGNVPLAKGYGMQPVYHVRWGQANIDAQLRAIMRRFKLRSVPSEYDGAPDTPGAMAAYAKRNSSAAAAAAAPSAADADGEERRPKADASSTPSSRAQRVSEAGSHVSGSAPAAPGTAAAASTSQTSPLLPPLRSALTTGDGKPRGGSSVASGNATSPLVRKLTFRAGQ